jgi:hypothetical protein
LCSKRPSPFIVLAMPAQELHTAELSAAQVPSALLANRESLSPRYGVPPTRLDSRSLPATKLCHSEVNVPEQPFLMLSGLREVLSRDDTSALPRRENSKTRATTPLGVRDAITATSSGDNSALRLPVHQYSAPALPVQRVSRSKPYAKLGTCGINEMLPRLRPRLTPDQEWLIQLLHSKNSTCLKDGYELSYKQQSEHTNLELWHYRRDEGLLEFTSIVATSRYPGRIPFETGTSSRICHRLPILRRTNPGPATRPPRDSDTILMKRSLTSADQTVTLQRARLEARLVTASDYASAFLPGNDSSLLRVEPVWVLTLGCNDSEVHSNDSNIAIARLLRTDQLRTSAKSSCDAPCCKSFAIQPAPRAFTASELQTVQADHSIKSYEPILNSDASTAQRASSMSIFALLISSKTTFAERLEGSSTRECDDAVAPQAEHKVQAIFDAKLQSCLCRDVSPGDRLNHADEESLQTGDGSLRSSDVFIDSAHSTPHRSTSTSSARRASAVQDKGLTTVAITTRVLPTMTRLTKKSASQGLSDSSVSNRKNLSSNNNTLNIRHAKDFNSPLLEELAGNQDLPWRASTVASQHSRPHNTGAPCPRSSERATIDDDHLSEHQGYYCPHRPILRLPTASAHEHFILALGTAEPRAKSYLQILQISFNSRRALHPSDQLLQKTRYKARSHGSKEHCLVEMVSYLVIHRIVDVAPTTSVLGSRFTVLNCDAMPAQSQHDDSNIQLTAPFGVCDAPTPSDDCDAMAGGAGCDAPALRQHDDDIRSLRTREDSYRRPHESNLRIVSLNALFPTGHERQGTRKCHHTVKRYSRRLMSRRSSSLKILTVPRAAAIFTRKITAMTLADTRNASTVSADRDVAVRVTKATTTESTLQSNLAQPLSTSLFDAAAERANIDALVQSCIPDRLPVQQDRDATIARLLPASHLIAASVMRVPQAMTPQPANERLEEVETKPSNAAPIPATRRLCYPAMTSSTTVSAPRLSVDRLASPRSTKGRRAETRSEVKSLLAQLAYWHGHERIPKRVDSTMRHPSNSSLYSDPSEPQQPQGIDASLRYGCSSRPVEDDVTLSRLTELQDAGDANQTILRRRLINEEWQSTSQTPATLHTQASATMLLRKTLGLANSNAPGTTFASESTDYDTAVTLAGPGLEVTSATNAVQSPVSQGSTAPESSWSSNAQDVRTMPTDWIVASAPAKCDATPIPADKDMMVRPHLHTNPITEEDSGVSIAGTKGLDQPWSQIVLTQPSALAREAWNLPGSAALENHDTTVAYASCDNSTRAIWPLIVTIRSKSQNMAMQEPSHERRSQTVTDPTPHPEPAQPSWLLVLHAVRLSARRELGIRLLRITSLCINDLARSTATSASRSTALKSACNTTSADYKEQTTLPMAPQRARDALSRSFAISDDSNATPSRCYSESSTSRDRSVRTTALAPFFDINTSLTLTMMLAEFMVRAWQLEREDPRRARPLSSLLNTPTSTNSAHYDSSTPLHASRKMTIRPLRNRIKTSTDTDVFLAFRHFYHLIRALWARNCLMLKKQFEPSSTARIRVSCLGQPLRSRNSASIIRLLGAMPLHKATAKMSAAFITSLFACPEFPLPSTNFTASGQPVSSPKLTHSVAYTLHRNHLASCVTIASLFLLKPVHLVKQFLHKESHIRQLLAVKSGDYFAPSIATNAFRLKALRDNYDTAPQDASDVAKPTIQCEVPTYQHFLKAAELHDANETSTTIYRRLIIDKERWVMSPTPATLSLQYAATALCHTSRLLTPAASLQETLSSTQLEAEPDAKLTLASIDVAARSARTKLKRFYSLLPRPSWTLARHWDIQSPLSVVSSDVQDTWAAPADQKAEQAQAEYDVILASVNANADTRLRFHGTLTRKIDDGISCARWHNPAGLQGQPSASPEQDATPAHGHGSQSSDADPSVLWSHALPSEYFTTDTSEDAMALIPGATIQYPAPSAPSNILDIQATPTNRTISSKLAECDVTHALANDNDAPWYQLAPTVLTDLATRARDTFQSEVLESNCEIKEASAIGENLMQALEPLIIALSETGATYRSKAPAATAQNPSRAAAPKRASDTKVNGTITRTFLRLAVDFGSVTNNLTRRQGLCYAPHHKMAQISNVPGQTQDTPDAALDLIHSDQDDRTTNWFSRVSEPTSRAAILLHIESLAPKSHVGLVLADISRLPPALVHLRVMATSIPQATVMIKERPPKPLALTPLPWDTCDKSRALTPSLTIGMAFGDATKCMGNLDASLNAYDKHRDRLFIETCTCLGAIAHRCEGLTKAIICWQQVIEPPPDNEDVWSATGHCLWDDWLKVYTAYQQALYLLPNPRTRYLRHLASANPVLRTTPSGRVIVAPVFSSHGRTSPCDVIIGTLLLSLRISVWHGIRVIAIAPGPLDEVK